MNEVNTSTRLDLTATQSLIWMSQQLSEQTPQFNMAHRFDIARNLDADLFQRAVQSVVERSDALRTVFVKTSAGVEQRVVDTLTVEVPFVDFSQQTEPEVAAQEWLQEKAQVVIDLEKSCHESALLKLSESHWIWYFNIHHLISDAWSISVICQAVSSTYEVLASGGSADEVLPPFLAYRDYENKWRQSKPFRAASEFWKQQSKAASGLVALYGYKGSRNATAACRKTIPLGRSRSERLTALAEQPEYRGLSPHFSRFNLLATVVMAYLNRVSGSQRLTIGAPVANRPSPVFKQTIGMFIETLPFSVELDAGETFQGLFDKVANESKQFLRYAQPGSSTPALARKFNVVFNYINTSFGDFAGQPMSSDLVHNGYVDSGHDLRIQLHDFGGQGELVAYFDINEGTLPASIQGLMGDHFLAVVDAFLENQERAVNSVNLVSTLEQGSLLSALNERWINPEPTQVLESFARQVSAGSERVAVREGEVSLSYSDLDAWSDQVAQQLIDQGNGKGDVVGIYLPRGLEFLCAVLGVLKSGAAFVPLESRLPTDRLKFILNDAGVKRVIGPAIEGNEMLTVSCQPLGEYDPDNTVGPLPAVAPVDLAYVMYTSGSSGFPKGVAVRHHALSAYALWASATYAGSEPATFPLYSAVGFDLTITSIFVPLVSGGSVVVYPETDSRHDLSVLQVFDDDTVDVVKLTPAHLALVMEQPRQLSRIRKLILGGENLTTELCLRARQVLGDVEIYNEYGPTEAIVGCMVHRFNPAEDTGPSVPIGVPAGHHRIYLLDEGLNPVPAGVPAELCIAGQQLAVGYLNREDETAERFVEDPFVPGQMMYRTGDLARLNQSGLVEFLGRNDEQVKVGGVRIEPAEIQRQVSAFPGIGECVVDVLELIDHETGDDAHFCTRCGISSEYPGISFNAQGVCELCVEFDSYRDRADVYFSEMGQLRKLLADARGRRTGQYDCIMLLSGGKDSTYALYRLAELGPDILTLTLDNGFISEGAKANIQRVADEKGIDHRFVSTPAMNEIFSDSLKRHSNVCQGCFKTIYTLAMQTAIDEGIPYIVTGLSRGQFFETRLTPELFQNKEVELEEIEQTILTARKAYHGVDDAVTRLLDCSMFENDRVFNQVKFIDFYRYCDVGLDEVYRYLSEQAPWVRPEDTGRSTNCLINDAGIYVHKRKEGFHNYALPYSWDVRMGHKTREEALDELNDQIDVVRVHEMLDEIGYSEEAFSHEPQGKRLVVYYTQTEAVDEAELRQYLNERLPASMVPSFFVAISEVPLTGNGKVDRAALPVPRVGRPPVTSVFIEPRNPMETLLAQIWREVLDVRRVGVLDNYYALGGDSISAIQIASRALAKGLRLEATEIFEHQTVEALAEYLAVQQPGDQAEKPADDLPDPEKFGLANLDAGKLSKLEEMLAKKRS